MLLSMSVRVEWIRLGDLLGRFLNNYLSSAGLARGTGSFVFLRFLASFNRLTLGDNFARLARQVSIASALTSAVSVPLMPRASQILFLSVANIVSIHFCCGSRACLLWILPAESTGWPRDSNILVGGLFEVEEMIFFKVMLVRAR